MLGEITLAKLGVVFQLAILEGLLSFDNALALAALVSKRLKHDLDRKHALIWGIWGAYGFRVVIVFIGVWLMGYEWVKFLAGAYLVLMAVNELLVKNIQHKVEEAESEDLATDPASRDQVTRASISVIWRTIIAVELMDIMFSIDSIAVALAVSRETWVLISGAVLGILMMRVAAQYFIRLIEKFPILVPTAFVLVGIAGLKVLIEVKHLEFGNFTLPMLGLHVPEWIMLPLMVTILLGAIAYNAKNPEKFRHHVAK